MTMERWERNLADAARGYNDPPATPRDRMWERLQTARAPRPQATSPWWTRRQVLWPAAVVAALLVGVTAGRFTRPLEPAPVTSGTHVASVAAPSATGSNAYQLAALPILNRTETLLMQVQGGVDRTAGESFGERALGLLGQTRLLLGSPAADDPELKSLLEDLEIALVRVARLTAGPRAIVDSEEERQILEQGLARNALLPRLREQLANNPATTGL